MPNILNLSTELQTIAVNQLNEVPHRIREDIEHIRSWLSKQPHLKTRTDDTTLILFLRSCKYSLERTKKKLELYYTMKTACPDLFRNRDPSLPIFQHVFSQNAMSILPGNPNGPLLIMVRLGNLNPERLPLEDLLRISMVFFETTLLEHANSSIVGQAFLLDYENASLKYIMQATPTFIKKTVTFFEIACPSRTKAIYYINTPRIFASIFNIIKTFLSKKLQERVFCYAVNEKPNIERYFPASVLPTEYGGLAGPFSDMCADFKLKVEKYREWFLEDENYRCLEDKRTVTSKLDIDLHSFDGSFRKLEID